MPPRDPTKVQLDFPLLVADLIDQLKLLGPVGLLDFNPAVQPVFLIGSRGITFGSLLPDFDSSEVYFGQATDPIGNVVLIDTGALAAGTYDLGCNLSATGNAGQLAPLRLEHRNAANNATLATLFHLSLSLSTHDYAVGAMPTIGYNIGLNERLRIVSGGSVSDSLQCGTIYASLRPTP
mgnify:CR=1 FL=1|jgi:hypothetical protein